MNQKKNILFYGIGFLLSLVFIYIFVFFAYYNFYIGLLWACYIGIFLMIIGIFFKKSNLILSQIIILLVLDLFWISDFFYRFTKGTSLFGINNYFFGGTLPNQILSFQHIVTPILALSALALIKIKKDYKALWISFIEIIGFFILGFIIPSKYGINCLPISKTCFSFVFPEFIPYPLIWFAMGFSFTTLSYFIITSLPFLKKKKYRNPYK